MTDIEWLMFGIKFFVGFCGGMLVAQIILYLAKLAGWSNPDEPR
jgi:hypothetical protein